MSRAHRDNPPEVLNLNSPSLQWLHTRGSESHSENLPMLSDSSSHTVNPDICPIQVKGQPRGQQMVSQTRSADSSSDRQHDKINKK